MLMNKEGKAFIIDAAQESHIKNTGTCSFPLSGNVDSKKPNTVKGGMLKSLTIKAKGDYKFHDAVYSPALILLIWNKTKQDLDFQ